MASVAKEYRHLPVVFSFFFRPNSLEDWHDGGALVTWVEVPQVRQPYTTLVASKEQPVTQLDKRLSFFLVFLSFFLPPLSFQFNVCSLSVMLDLQTEEKLANRLIT